MASEIACNNHDGNVPGEVTSSNSEDPKPEVDIMINNVVCSFNIRCHLNLKYIALNGYNVEYRRENGMVTMKLRNPPTTASIWSSGKITCTGATSHEDARKAARRFAKIIQQLGFNAKFANFRIVNVLGTCSMPFAIKISQFSMANRKIAIYEPELHPGVTYRIKDLKATLKIFSTGSITVTAPSIDNVQQAIEHIYPLVAEFKRDKPPPKSLKVPNHVSSSSRVKVEDCDSMSEEDEEEEDSSNDAVVNMNGRGHARWN